MKIVLINHNGFDLSWWILLSSILKHPRWFSLKNCGGSFLQRSQWPWFIVSAARIYCSTMGSTIREGYWLLRSTVNLAGGVRGTDQLRSASAPVTVTRILCPVLNRFPTGSSTILSSATPLVSGATTSTSSFIEVVQGRPKLLYLGVPRVLCDARKLLWVR